MSEGDGIIEELQRAARVALTAAARVGTALARVQQDQLRRAAQQSQTRQRELAGQIAQAQTQARGHYQLVEDPQWWNHATVDQVGEVYQDAVTYSGTDDRAAHARERIETEVSVRYGVDLTHIDPNQAGPRLQEASEKLSTNPDRDPAAAARDLGLAEAADRGAGSTTDAPPVAAGPLVEPAVSATATGNAPEARAPGWDTRERRARTEAGLRQAGVPEQQIQARMLADVAQARPPAEAAKTPPTQGPKARRSPSTAPSRDRELGR